MGFSLTELSISPSHDSQAGAAPAVEAGNTPQYARHAGNGLVAVALIGSGLRLSPAPSKPATVDGLAGQPAPKDAARTMVPDSEPRTPSGQNAKPQSEKMFSGFRS